MSDLDYEQNINSDSDAEEYDDDTFDNYDDFIDFVPSPSECENELEDNNSLSNCFEQSYDVCSTFFMGSLRDACRAAFGPSTIQERRPVLVYIYNDEGLLRKNFSETMFYSTTISDYINMNYVVWPWKINFESNRYTLAKIWEDMFSVQFFDEFSIDQCPLLIGIMRLSEYKTDETKTSEYQFKSLIKGKTLTRTQMIVDCDTLLNELDHFKEKCDKNEQDLSFNFIKKTGLCWEIIVEIAQYLSLNDAISAFSIDILFLLNNFQSKFQLSNPRGSFIKMILSKIKSEQIISLKLNANRLESKTDFALLSNFKQIISITLQNPSHYNQIRDCIKSFPNLTRLSLYYDKKVNYNILSDVLNQLQQQIKRFEIHCPGIFSTGNCLDQLSDRYTVPAKFEYFLLDFSRSIYERLQLYKSCYLIGRTGFMSKIPNIRCIHFIINKYDTEHFLDEEQWEILIDICSELKKIILQVLGNTSQDEPFLIKKVLGIQTKLRTIRQTIKFQISFL